MIPTNILLITWLEIFAGLGNAEVGDAYHFTAKGDPWNPVPYAACLKRDMDDAKDAIVAHRTLPCRSHVLVYSEKTQRATVAMVGDRGPYGRRRNGGYTAILDMSSIVNRRLKARGHARVLVIPLPHLGRGRHKP